MASEDIGGNFSFSLNDGVLHIRDENRRRTKSLPFSIPAMKFDEMVRVNNEVGLLASGCCYLIQCEPLSVPLPIDFPEKIIHLFQAEDVMFLGESGSFYTHHGFWNVPSEKFVLGTGGSDMTVGLTDQGRLFELRCENKCHLIPFDEKITDVKTDEITSFVLTETGKVFYIFEEIKSQIKFPEIITSFTLNRTRIRGVGISGDNYIVKF